MAPEQQPAPLPPAATRQSSFEQAVACALHLWPALSLAVQNGWGGPASADKRDWFAGAVVDLFPAFADGDAADPSKSASAAAAADEPDADDVEAVLLQVMMDEFEVNVDDDSAADVAAQVVCARAQCARGQFDESEALQDRFRRRQAAGAKVDAIFTRAQDADQDTDWETDGSQDDDDDDGNHGDGGADITMNDAPPPATAAHQKPLPQVDQDGFTMVTRRKK